MIDLGEKDEMAMGVYIQHGGFLYGWGGEACLGVPGSYNYVSLIWMMRMRTRTRMTIAILLSMTMAMDCDYDDDHERLTCLALPPTYFFTFWRATLGRYLEDFSDYARLFPPRSKRDTRQ